MTPTEQFEQVKLVLQVLELYRKGDIPAPGARALLFRLILTTSEVENIIPT